MADTKTISFKFVVDPQSVSQVKRVLQELTQQAEKFAKAMQGAGGGLFGGGTVGAGAGAKSQAQTTSTSPAGAGAVAVNVGGIRREAEEGVKGLEKLTGAVRRSTQQQRQDLSSLDKVMGDLIGKFRQFSTPMGAIRGIAGMMGPSPAAAGGAGAGAGGAGAAGAGAFAGAGALGVAGAVAGLAYLGAKGYVGYRNFAYQGLRTEAAAGQSLFAPYRAVATGDISDALAMSQMSAADRETMRGYAANTTGNASMSIIEHPWEAAKNAVWGVFNEGAAEKAWKNQQTAWQHQKIRDMVDLQKQTAETQRLTFGQSVFENTLGSRVTAQSIYGVQGYGISQGIDPTLGNDSTAANQLYIPATARRLTWADMESRAQRRGFTVDQQAQADVAMRAQVGRIGMGFGMTTLEATRAGYVGYEGILAKSLVAGNRADLYAMGGPLAKDRQLGIQLASGILQGYNPAGTTGGIGALAAAQGALAFERGRGLTDAALVQQQLGGIALGEQVFQGASSPLQTTRNFLAARVAAPGVSRQGVDALSKLGYTQALDIINGKAKLPDNLAYWGVTKDNIKEYVEGKHGVGASMLFDIVNPHDNSPASQALSRMEAWKSRTGKGTIDYLRTKEGKRDSRMIGAAAAASGIGPVGSMEAFVEQIAHPGKARRGHAPAAGFDALTTAKFEMEAKLTKVRERAVDPTALAAAMQVTPQNAGVMAFSKNAGDAAAALIAAGVAVQALAGTAAAAGAAGHAGGNKDAHAGAKAGPKAAAK